MSPLHDVVAVVVHHRGVAMTAECVKALPADIAVVVVDNSGDAIEIRTLLSGRGETVVVGDGTNVGFGRGCNLGVMASDRPVVALINPDARPSIDDLRSLVTMLNQLHSTQRVAAVGPALVDPAGSVQVDGGGWQPTPSRSLAHALLSSGAGRWGVWIRPTRTRRTEVEWLSGTCLVVARDAFESVGGFDPSYPLYNEDMDLGARLRQRGWRLVLEGAVRVPHLRGGSGVVEPADQTQLWRLRGSALGVYLHRHASGPFSERLMQLTFAFGFVLRAGVYRGLGRRGRAREMLTYAREVRRAELMELS